MATVKKVKVNLKKPTRFKVRSAGKWDTMYSHTFTNWYESYSFPEMKNYDGLRKFQEMSYDSADTLDFSQTVLPWKWDYSHALSTKKYCLMPVGTIYNNVKGLGYNYNFETVGSPVIDNQTKIISGFSADNYIKTPTALDLNGNTWEMLFKIRTPSTISSFMTIACDCSHDNYQSNIGFQTHFQIVFSTNSSSYDLTGEGSYTVLPNTDYWVRTSFSGTEYKLEYSLDGTTYVTDITLSSEYNFSNAIWNIARSVNNSYTYPFSGSIDFSECYVKINNINFWVPTFTETNKKAVTSNTKIIGDVIVDSEGVASSFSSSRYIEAPAIQPGNNPWELRMKFVYNTNGYDQRLCGGLNDTTVSKFVIGSGTTWSHNLILWMSSTGSSWNLANCSRGSTSLQNGQTYYLKMVFDGTKYVISLSQDNETWNQEIVVNNSTPITNVDSPFTVGRSETTLYWSGLIDLTDTYFSVNNVEIWRGVGDLIESLPGCTYNYTDTGAATNLNCFVVNHDQSIVLTPDASYTNGWKLGTVSIPEHNAYTYNNGVWTKFIPTTTLHVYDRVDNKATVVGFFVANDTKRYALCVLDASYRTGSGVTWGKYNFNTLIPNYTTAEAAQAAKDTGTSNTNVITNNYLISEYPAFLYARQGFTVTVDDKTFLTCLPTLDELSMIYSDRVVLDTYDPTLEDYPERSLTTFKCGGTGGLWSSNEQGPNYAWKVDADDVPHTYRKDQSLYGVVPVVEIEVDENGTVV